MVPYFSDVAVQVVGPLLNTPSSNFAGSPRRNMLRYFLVAPQFDKVIFIPTQLSVMPIPFPVRRVRI